MALRPLIAVRVICSRRSFVFNLSTGLFAGYFICSIIQYAILPCLTGRTKQQSGDESASDSFLTFKFSGLTSSGQNFAAQGYIPSATTDKNLILIGVMTAKVFLQSRVMAAYNTWAKTIPGKVIFFSSEGSSAGAPDGVPIVELPGVDDSYPPQRKSFMMLRYMHDNHLDDFRFFMRADDDVYIKGETLARFLHSVNASRALFIGQAGLGNKEEYGMLRLKALENFCMGGPGIIMTRSTLARLVPHVSHCLGNLLTTHEDVELGRCVSRYAKVSCTWAYEMQKIFYNNYNEPRGSFSQSLNDPTIHNAATLHPVKNPLYQYRLDQYFMSRRVFGLRNELSRLRREISWVTDVLRDRDEFYSPDRYGMMPTLMKTVARNRHDVLEWDFLAKSVFSARHANPRRSFERDMKLALDDIITQVMDLINENARQRGRIIEYREMLYGYHRVNPMHGADFILDLLLYYKKFKGKRRMTVPVRRHAYVQQAFLEVEFLEEEEEEEHLGRGGKDVKNSLHNVTSDESGIFYDIRRRIGLWSAETTQSSIAAATVVGLQHADLRIPIVNFVLPLSGRHKTFLLFMNNFEETCLKQDEAVSLAVISFRSEQDDRTDDTMQYIATLQQKYSRHRIIFVRLPGSFSRGVALQHGISLYGDGDLLFFIDVDVYMRADVLQRIRLNTVRGHQVYYPIVFSQYNPQFVCEAVNTSCALRTSRFHFDSQFGYWRYSGYGMVAAFNSDLKRVGGFDISIKGWGKEDVDLLQKFITFNMTVFRSVDIGLVHVYHSIVCDPSLDPAQYQMCVGSKASAYASIEKLASIVYKTPEIFHRNESPLEGKLPGASDGRES